MNQLLPRYPGSACLTGLVALVVGVGLQAQPAASRSHPARGLELETIEWMDDGAEFLDQRRFKTALTKDEKAVDREALLLAALGRARELGRPVLWYVYRVIEKSKRGRQMIRSPVLNVYLRQIVLSDPDVERIVKSSFVPLRMVCDQKLVDRFGLQPLEFLEPGFVFLKPDGEVIQVVKTIRTFDALWFTGVLRRVLEKSGAAAPKNLDGALDRGDWARALRFHEQRDGHRSPGDLYAMAGLRRRSRDGDGALALLDRARSEWSTVVEEVKAGDDRRARTFDRAVRGQARGGYADDDPAKALAELNCALEVERGLLSVRMGRFADAVAPLENAAASAVGERRAEAAYVLGLLRLRVGDEIGAVRRFQKIAQEHPDDLYGRRARANVLIGVDDNRPLGAAFYGVERLTWMPDEAYAGLPEDTRWVGPAPAPASLIKTGVRFLLTQQRKDGGFNDSRYAYCPDARITPNVWVAVTALCSQALLRHRDRVADAGTADEIDEALLRSDGYLFDASRLNRGRNEDVYADAYRLSYLVHRQQSGPEAVRRKARLRMRSIIDDAQARQKESGFWAHEYDNAFCTAALVQGLLAARDSGAEIPAAMTDRARDALLAARFGDGSFSYSRRARGRPRKDSLKNASTRMPMCEGALLGLGASTPQKLFFAFENFWEQFHRIEGVRRTDFHSDGQLAGFMFFHALWHTSEAIALLPPEQRADQHRRMMEHLLRFPEMDGTFVDSHELGRSYGTAMALLIMANALDVMQ